MFDLKGLITKTPSLKTGIKQFLFVLCRGLKTTLSDKMLDGPGDGIRVHCCSIIILFQQSFVIWINV